MMRRMQLILVLLVVAGAIALGGVWWLIRTGDCGWDFTLSRPGMDEPVRSLAIFDDGAERSLYAGGFFSEAGGEPIGRVARWDGTRWHQVARGINGPVRAMTVFDDGTGDALYIAGQFTTLRGIEVNHIARFDGENWSRLGRGMDDWVLALAVADFGEGPALYAAGEFTRAGDQAAQHVARWNGKQWYPLSEGVNGAVHALATMRTAEGQTKLIAGGAFRNAGGAQAQHIAQWDGSQWSCMNGGVDDHVYALTALPMPDGSERIIAGGRFTYAGVQQASHIAQWDGRSWRPLGEGMDHEVQALASARAESAARQSPVLFAGGRFRSAGGRSVSRLARWDGERWHAIAPGPDERVQALLLDEAQPLDAPTLYVGGSFTGIGRRNAGFIAAWRKCSDAND